MPEQIKYSVTSTKGLVTVVLHHISYTVPDRPFLCTKVLELIPTYIQDVSNSVLQTEFIPRD